MRGKLLNSGGYCGMDVVVGQVVEYLEDDDLDLVIITGRELVAKGADESAFNDSHAYSFEPWMVEMLEEPCQCGDACDMCAKSYHEKK